MRTLYNYIKYVKNRIYASKSKRKLNQFLSSHRRQHKIEYSNYEIILKKIKIAGGKTFALQAYKLFSLSSLLEYYKPKTILELGGGSSTAIFADYAKKMGAELVSYDESEYWINTTMKLININENEKNIKLFYANRIINLNDKLKEIKHDIKFERTYDFVFIDGPQLTVDGINHKDAINTNIFDILLYGYPKVIVVDIRKATVEEIIKRIGDKYNVFISDIITKNIQEDLKYFSVFELKNINI